MSGKITNRSDLYQCIWENYASNKENKQNSFIYAYLRDKKNAQAVRIADTADTFTEYRARKRRDKYVLLRSAYIAYKDNKLSKDEYINIFFELIGQKNRKKSEPFSTDQIKKAEEAYERVFLLGCISDFFYNHGYRLRDNESKKIITGDIGYAKTAERNIKEEDGYIDDIELLDQYYKKGNPQQPNCLNDNPQQSKLFSELTDDYKEKCCDLFQTLKKKCSKKTLESMFLPLYFDVNSGAGMAIIGKKHLDVEEEACRVGVYYFFEPNGYCSGDESDEYGGISDSSVDITMFIKLFDNIYDAFKYFEKGVSNFGFIDNYCLQNGYFLEGIDNTFRCFFTERPQQTGKTKTEKPADADAEKKQIEKYAQERTMRQNHINKKSQM